MNEFDDALSRSNRLPFSKTNKKLTKAGDDCFDIKDEANTICDLNDSINHLNIEEVIIISDSNSDEIELVSENKGMIYLFLFENHSKFSIALRSFMYL